MNMKDNAKKMYETNINILKILKKFKKIKQIKTKIEDMNNI